MILYWNNGEYGCMFKRYKVNSISKEVWEVKNKIAVIFHCTLIQDNTVSELRANIGIISDGPDYDFRELSYLIDSLNGLNIGDNEIKNNSKVKLRKNMYDEVIMEVEISKTGSDLTTNLEFVFPKSEVKII